MSTTGGILPTYQRFVNGVPVPSFSRRSFRPREKYLIFLVFLTFGLVCFGTFFFLPEFRGSNSTVESVYKVYQHMQNAGPELLIPAPPHLSDSSDALKLIRHDDDKVDPHVIDDRAKLLAKIEQDAELKVLERPNMDLNKPRVSSSTSIASKVAAAAAVAEEPREAEAAAVELVPQVAPIVTVPPALSDRYPDVNRGEDSDPLARERRAKVKECMSVSDAIYDSGWWIVNNLDMRRSILFVMNRSTKGIKLRAGGLLDFTLDNFMKAMRALFSILQFLWSTTEH